MLGLAPSVWDCNSHFALRRIGLGYLSVCVRMEICLLADEKMAHFMLKYIMR